MSQEKEWSKGVKITNKQKKNNKLYSTFGFSRKLANNNHRTIEGKDCTIALFTHGASTDQSELFELLRTTAAAATLHRMVHANFVQLVQLLHIHGGEALGQRFPIDVRKPAQQMDHLVALPVAQLALQHKEGVV